MEHRAGSDVDVPLPLDPLDPVDLLQNSRAPDQNSGRLVFEQLYSTLTTFGQKKGPHNIKNTPTIGTGRSNMFNKTKTTHQKWVLKGPQLSTKPNQHIKNGSGKVQHVQRNLKNIHQTWVREGPK